MYKQQLLVSGGTFDHFHKGHKAFIDAQLIISKKVLIGVTSDAYVNGHKKGLLENYETRVENIKKYLLSQGALERVELAQIDDLYIPKVWQKFPIEAIAVTADTKEGALVINEQREKQGLPALVIYTILEEKTPDGKVISSYRIRKGEIDRNGIEYIEPVWIAHILQLPDALRAVIAEPFGKLFENFNTLFSEKMYDPMKVACVGDVVTESLQKMSYGQKISIVDLHVKREKTYSSLSMHTIQGNERVIEVKNPPGYITPELFSAVKKSLFDNERYIFLIDGEEDLAVLPLILLAPLGFSIFYGQPGKGIVSIIVTEEKKDEAKKLLKKFTLLASK